MNKNKNPYLVPPFNVKNTTSTIHYYWWSWHPNYPYWSKSCWGGPTIEEAQDALKKPQACSMRFYYNKLIKEENGVFTEILDLPCQELETWRKIARNKKWRKATDAKPIKGWDK